jgi:predicted dienelactone hydrolase
MNPTQIAAAFLIAAFSISIAAISPQAHGQTVPSRHGIDAPQLAPLGPHQVGVRTLTLVQPKQADITDINPKTGKPTLKDRTLVVDIWYPANPAVDAKLETYRAEFRGEPPLPPSAFSVPGLAVRDAPANGGGYPLVVVSHGYSNHPAAMTWLTENLASKGYVVAAIHHEDPDPDRSDAVTRAIPTLRRPIDIGFTTRNLQASLGTQIDPNRVALIGYSMGGYGVLTSGGASLDPKGPAMGFIPGGALLPYAKGAAKAGDIKVQGLKAVVAIAPAGGGALAAWNSEGLADITAPLLLISGDRDPTVEYKTGALTVYNQAIHSDRYLLTFREAGHALGLNPAPPQMQARLWDKDWFDDPIWRTDRVNAINLHFITAFLDLKLKGVAEMNSYLDVPTVVSDDGVWPYDQSASYDAFSTATGGSTVWKGFQRRHMRGLELRHAKPD